MQDSTNQQPLPQRSTHVSIVIVNWNERQLLTDCLTSVYAQSYTNFDLWVVDNGSHDGSVEWIKTTYPNINVISNAANLGFAPANNQGIRASRGDYIALLNNDTIVDQNWLAALVETLDANSTVGMCASQMLLTASGGVIDSRGIAIDRAAIAWGIDGGKPSHNGVAEVVQPVFGASAGAALYRRAMLDEIGLFDEKFFAYLEDVDLAWRAQWANWRALYVSKAIVHHLHSATSNKIPHFKSRLLGRNKVWMIVKNYPMPQLLFYLPVIILYEAASLIYAWRQRRLHSALAGRFEACRNLPAMWQQRKKVVRRITSSQMFAQMDKIQSVTGVLQRYVHVKNNSSNRQK